MALQERSTPYITDLGNSVYVHTCTHCGHEWASKNDSPLRCGRCKSYNWNKPRIRTQKGAK